MPKYDGVKYICDRCSVEEFVPYQPLHAKYGDKEPAEWTQVQKDVWLCPTCSEMYGNMMKTFLATGPVTAKNEA